MTEDGVQSLLVGPHPCHHPGVRFMGNGGALPDPTRRSAGAHCCCCVSLAVAVQNGHGIRGNITRTARTSENSVP